MPFRRRLFTHVAVIAIALPWIASAQVIPAPAEPQVGSSNPVSPEPNVPRPSTTPCTVTLFSNFAFSDFSNLPLTFAPPTGCAAPWSRVVLTVDFTAPPNVLYDRTATIFLGGANLFFGTTAAPLSNFRASWHVERDLTDYSVIFTKPQTGNAALNNLTFATAQAVIYGTAKLLFYPANEANPAPVVPSQVLSLSGNTTYSLNDVTDRYDATFTLPRNIARAYLDVISQGRDNNELWFLCVPPAATLNFAACGYTAFRESDVYIDAIPAGVAPVFPWIYTGNTGQGSTDPYLWQPIVGIETLNFKPYRVNLTPFAGLLSDGNPHSVDVSVFNSDHGFSGAANLLLYTDPGTPVITGGLTQDTLSYYPSPSNEIYVGTAADGEPAGQVSVESFRAWQISGYVVTAKGRTDTTLTATNSFKNLQSLSFGKQNVNQEADQQETTTEVGPGGTVQTIHSIRFPLVYDDMFIANDSNVPGFYQSFYVHQQKIEQSQTITNGNASLPSLTDETVENSDVAHLDANENVVSREAISRSTFGERDANDICFYRQLTAQNLKLTQVNDSTNCSAVQ